MSVELMGYANGTVPVPRRDREVSQRATPIYDEVRLAALKADGALALGDHLMEGIVSLDSHRRVLAGGDPVTNAMLADIEGQALRSVKKIQANLYEDRGL